jgi:hypothetical protein
VSLLTVFPLPLRRLLARGYLLLAVAAPLMVLLIPGQPPLSLNEQLLVVKNGRFVDDQAVLGKGADNYSQQVVGDLAGVVASTSADYPDGGNVLLALFDSPRAAAAAQNKLKRMIPHQKEAHDLWATHFASDSGEYVMLARVERLLVMIITEREAMARSRLATLPALNYHPHPGLGAVLRQQPAWQQSAVLLFYAGVQWLLVRMLFAWARPGDTKDETGAGH